MKNIILPSLSTFVDSDRDKLSIELLFRFSNTFLSDWCRSYLRSVSTKQYSVFVFIVDCQRTNSKYITMPNQSRTNHYRNVASRMYQYLMNHSRTASHDHHRHRRTINRQPSNQGVRNNRWF